MHLCTCPWTCTHMNALVNKVVEIDNNHKEMLPVYVTVLVLDHQK
uniref:Uncharacterized protein n=1 Tax=Rhizophora mucronata TaxID=61149 RepID=A0A2P2QDT7_RHIMU